MDYKLVDLRIVDRNIRKGKISRKEYDTFVSALPDVEDNATELILDDDLEEEAEEEASTDLEEVGTEEASTDEAESAE
jgi:hypothetical protein